MRVKIYVGLALLGASLPLILIIISNKSFSSGQIYNIEGIYQNNNNNNNNNNNHNNNDQFCTTSGCRLFENYLLQSIDYATNPCDDFYQFACGRAISSSNANPQNADQDANNNNINIFDEAPKKVEAQLKQLLEDTRTYPSGTNRNLIRLRKYYSSCMNESALLKLGIAPLWNVIQKLGGFPILGRQSNYSESDMPLTHLSWFDKLVAFKFAGIAENFFLNLAIRPNYENNSLASIYLEQPTADFKEMLTETDEWERKLDYKFTLFSLISLSANYSLQELNELYDFKSSLMAIMTNGKDTNRVNHTKIKLSQFNQSDLFNFKLNFHRDYIIKMMNIKQLMNYDQIIEVDLDYLYKLDNLLAQTEPRIILNFMYYKLIHQLRNYMYSPEWTEEKNCITLLQEDLTLGLSHEYVKHFVSEQSRSKVFELIERIKFEAKRSIDQAKWIKSDKTRQIARDKVDSIKPIVAYASQLMNVSLINEMQDPLELSEFHFMDNYLKISALDYAKEYEKFENSDMADSNWEMSSLTTESNAFYMLQYNSIIIYAGIMMLRFFDPTRAEYLNFGSLGSFIGHEMTHAFDPQGSQYDKRGNRLRTNWWDEQTLIGFKQNQKCFLEKYDNLPMPGSTGTNQQKLNGSFTLDENMADNGGFQLAYKAYKQWIWEQQQLALDDNSTAHPNIRLMPNLNFNHDQLFWLSLATIWCDPTNSQTISTSTNSTPDINQSHNVVNGKLDTHSPAKYRVNIPLANSRQFSEDFNCLPGSYMNPIEKCSVW